jgi:hypothetical protein
MGKTLRVNNVAALNKMLRRLPKEASAELRDASVDIAEQVAQRAAGRARMVGGVAKYVAPTIRPRRDRVPKIAMGGTARLPGRTGKNQTVGDVMWGAEFGSDRFRQFSPWRGNKDGAGYFLWPTVRDEGDFISDTYEDALLRAVDKAVKRR